MALDPTDLLNLALAEQELRRRQKETIDTADLFQIVPLLSPKYQEPRHITPAVETLMATEHSSQRLIISVPPRHGKTETLLHFIAWFLYRNPEKTIAYVSYNSEISGSKALQAQELMMKMGCEKNKRRANIDEFRLKQGGGLLTTSIGGKLTGFGVHVLIIDDPVKDRQEAESKTIRDKHWGWFEDVAETRLEPGASMIVLQTRWHEDDLSGRIIARRPGYQVVRIPALADGLDASGKTVYDNAGNQVNMDARGRALGEALWPDRYDKQWFDDIKSVKPLTFSALYQGLPRNKNDRVFQDATYYSLESKISDGYRASAGADLAYTESTRADHTAVVAGRQKENIIQITYAERWQKDINFTTTRLLSLQKTKVHAPFRIEANGPQKGIFGLLKRSGIKVVEAKLMGDKYSRAIEFADAWNQGLVQVPDPEEFYVPWLEDFLEEIYNFTGINDLEDDQVDAASHMYNGLSSARAKAERMLDSGESTQHKQKRVKSVVSMIGGRAMSLNHFNEREQ